MLSADDDYDFCNISLCECLQRNFLSAGQEIDSFPFVRFTISPIMNDEKHVLILTETFGDGRGT